MRLTKSGILFCVPPGSHLLSQLVLLRREQIGVGWLLAWQNVWQNLFLEESAAYLACNAFFIMCCLVGIDSHPPGTYRWLLHNKPSLMTSFRSSVFSAEADRDPKPGAILVSAQNLKGQG